MQEVVDMHDNQKDSDDKLLEIIEFETVKIKRKLTGEVQEMKKLMNDIYNKWKDIK
jgi:hypothetical protein